MTKLFSVLVILLVLFGACTKGIETPGLVPQNYKLKYIHYPIDTATPLCVNCPPEFTQQSELYLYDATGRIQSRVLFTKILSNNPVSIDSTVTHTYSYTGNSSVISGYTFMAGKHFLEYNSAEQLLVDSVTNPAVSNARVATFVYSGNNVIETSKQVYIVGTQITRDTFTMNGGNVVAQHLSTYANSNQPYWSLAYSMTYSSLVNPLSFCNNFSLFGSDNNNGVMAPLYKGELNSKNVVSQRVLLTPGPTVTSTVIATTDSLGRVVEIKDEYNNYRKTTYEYY